MRRAVLAWVVVEIIFASLAVAQPAPQRSDELCAVLKQTAVEKGLEFTVTRPGACWAEIDKGYTLTVGYSVNESMLAVGLMVEFKLLEDISAFWLRLSALDQLASLSLGTKQQSVFDELNKLTKQVGREMAPQLQQGKADAQEERFGKSQRATLLVTGTAERMHLQVSASTKDIDRMKRDRKREATGEISGWRRILIIALQAFAAGAKGYGEAYRAHYENPRRHRVKSCYTNFAGQWAFTHCY